MCKIISDLIHYCKDTSTVIIYWYKILLDLRNRTFGVYKLLRIQENRYLLILCACIVIGC